MSDSQMEYHDFVVETGNPEGLDDTLQRLPMARARVIGRGVPGGIQLVDGKPVVRVIGDPGFFKFACEHQGYCKVIRELEKQPMGE